MSLKGYIKSQGKKTGGIKNISICAATDISNLTYNKNNHAYSNIELRENCKFANYEFRENEASFSEEVILQNGIVSVKHTVQFSLERPDSNSAVALNELMKISQDGMIAIVATNSGINFLVGYSQDFAAEQPLRIDKSSLDSGEKYADSSLETITLVAEDNSIAAIYTGEFIQ